MQSLLVLSPHRLFGWSWLFIAGSLCLILGCMASSEFLHQSLEEGAEADLKIIVSDLPSKAKGSILAKPYYVVDEFQEFHGDTAMVFQAKAVIVFFYLESDLNLCQIRKYRFKRSAKSWERYEVELRHIPEKFIAPPPEEN